MKRGLLSLIALATLLLAPACQQQPVCTPSTGTPEYLTVPPGELAAPTPAPFPLQVEINGKLTQVDKVVEGPLCNDTWSGTVYVTCNFQVYPWDETPTFLKNCNLSIAPDTIVYVAYHNDTAYYNGCSCHTGEIAEP